MVSKSVKKLPCRPPVMMVFVLFLLLLLFPAAASGHAQQPYPPPPREERPTNNESSISSSISHPPPPLSQQFLEEDPLLEDGGCGGLSPPPPPPSSGLPSFLSDVGLSAYSSSSFSSSSSPFFPQDDSSSSLSLFSSSQSSRRLPSLTFVVKGWDSWGDGWEGASFRLYNPSGTLLYTGGSEMNPTKTCCCASCANYYCSACVRNWNGPFQWTVALAEGCYYAQASGGETNED